MSQRGLLLLCMCAGLALALSGITGSGKRDLPPDAMARVGERLLLKADYQRTINGIQAERRQPLDEAERQRVLDRLIDEYLLLAYAQREDLVFEVPELRKRSVDQVLQLLRNQADALLPDDTELQTFFHANRAYFSAGEPGPEAFSRLRDVVLAEWRRRQAERLLDELLQQLRDEVPLKIREDAV